MSHLGELYKHIFSPSTYLLHHYVIKLGGVLTEEIKKKKLLWPNNVFTGF